MHALVGLPEKYIDNADNVLITGDGATQEEANRDHNMKLKKLSE